MPKRIQLSRKKGWRMPPNCVSVARPTVFGNPWTLEKAIASKLFKPGTERKVCIDCYRDWLTRDDFPEAMEKFPIYQGIEEQRVEILRRLPELRGKDLACWCNGELCHADVLLELANG